MLLRSTLLQVKAITQCARATMEAVLDQAPHTPIEVTVDGWYARLGSIGWIKI